ncbi:hypothetical protein PIB30_087617 [Stylosanthes scabra]|uniref:Bifunctional inhibitor/plant lipid transfer protein/seed storage helical domain-containing protein n=1 Tax=Stylosanthes scabra TaxID=79078 RepID=A0ABU6TU71_9FABA|nr:hypothetical protein [Stylosanthes scabra]
MKKHCHYHYYYQQNMWLLLMLVALIVRSGDGASSLSEEKLTQKCGQLVQKVIPCLNYATGQASIPSKECCEAGTEIKENDPDCFCFLIQQTHHGNAQSKSLGIQEDKLLQLPSVCHVKNANISECPKLLGLSPSSPDAAIFTNSSKATPAAPLSSPTPPSSSLKPKAQSQNDSSYGVMLRPLMTMELIGVAMAIVLIAIPTGFVTVHI